MTRESIVPYNGFELGPIRPPSEAYSLIIRPTRNCSWNRCTFCNAYKGERFSLRPVSDVKKDIDQLFGYVETLRNMASSNGEISMDEVRQMATGLDHSSLLALDMSLRWCVNGMESVFLQDANSLIVKPDELVEILQYLRFRFPMIQRVTSYARSHTLARARQEHLDQIAEAGLNRVHIGFESGCDDVLRFVDKGCTREHHISGGLQARQAGMEVSFYFMPGLGGVRWSEPHAHDSADVVNQVNPHFVRIRSFRLGETLEMYERVLDDSFTILNETDLIRELKLFVELLDGVDTVISSDHMMNTLQDVEGQLPHEKQLMLDRIQTFLDLSPTEKLVYRIGRAMNLFRGAADFADPANRTAAEEACKRLGVTEQNIGSIQIQLGMTAS